MKCWPAGWPTEIDGLSVGMRVYLDRDDCRGLRGTVTGFVHRRPGVNGPPVALSAHLYSVEVDFDEKVFYGKLQLSTDEVRPLSAVDALSEIETGE